MAGFSVRTRANCHPDEGRILGLPDRAFLWTEILRLRPQDDERDTQDDEDVHDDGGRAG